MSDLNLNQDAVEVAAKRFYGLHGKGAWDASWEQLHPRVRAEYCTQIEGIVGSYLSALPDQNATSNQPDENAMRAAVEAVLNETYGNHGELAGIAVRAYVDALSAQPDVVSSVEGLVMTRAGLALANTAFGEGLSAGIRACNAAHRRQPFKNPVSPYSAPLLAMIKADKQVKE